MDLMKERSQANVNIKQMDGILIIDKPEGLTSHDVVSRVRRLLKTKRVGHTGTLDPFATGVLVMLIGRATRLAQFIDKDEKEYEATVKFGSETDSGDRTGTIKSETADAAEVLSGLSYVDWEDILGRFRGTIMQIPPMHSAKKIGGKKLYELARQGVEIERAGAFVNIRTLEIIHGSISKNEAKLHVVCSAGTYIRTLAEDIGREIGVGAHLTQLRRTRAGAYSIHDAVTLEDLAEPDHTGPNLFPIESAVVHLPKLLLQADRIEKTRCGLSTRIFDETFADGEHVAMFDVDSELIAIGTYDVEENCVQPKIVLI